MSLALVFAAALGASLLSFFTGFGLGTLLMPVLALFVSLPEAVAMTAVVHLIGNLAKSGALLKRAHGRTVLAFGLPALLAAFAGAELLLHLPKAQLPRMLGLLIAGMGALELWPRFQAWSVAPRYLPLGGLLSGFLGGLSGHQGALRSAFLLRLDLEPATYIATGAGIACLVDLARLAVYGQGLSALGAGGDGPLLLAGILGALVGVLGGLRLIHKTTLPALRWAVGLGLMALGLAMAGGWLG